MTRSAWLPDSPGIDYADDLQLLGYTSDAFLHVDDATAEAERLKARRPAGFHPNLRTTDMDTLTPDRSVDPSRWSVRRVSVGGTRVWAIHPPAAFYPRPVLPQIATQAPSGPGLAVRPADHAECLHMAQRWARHLDEFRTYLELKNFPRVVRS